MTATFVQGKIAQYLSYVLTTVQRIEVEVADTVAPKVFALPGGEIYADPSSFLWGGCLFHPTDKKCRQGGTTHLAQFLYL